MKSYFHIHSATMSPCTMHKPALELAKRSWLCAGCKSPLPGTGAVDVQLQAKPGRSASLSFVSGTSVAIGRKALVDRFPPDIVKSELHLGVVSDSDGRPLSDWLTIRGKHRVIVRGSENISHRVCKTCGRDGYFAMGREYLFPAPPSGISVLESHIFGFVVSQDVCEQLALGKERGVHVEEIPVRDEPLDSLGILSNP